MERFVGPPDHRLNVDHRGLRVHSTARRITIAVHPGAVDFDRVSLGRRGYVPLLPEQGGRMVAAQHRQEEQTELTPVIFA